MGCTGSKQARRDRRRSPSPLARSNSMPVHHPALRKGDSCHVVALTSSTLGSIRLDAVDEVSCGCRRVAEDEEDDEPMKKTLNDKRRGGGGDFAAEVSKAKAWSEMIERRIPAPRTPTKTPPNEPEVINTWEMMAGLEDVSPLYSFPARGGFGVGRSFSFHSVHDIGNEIETKPKAKLANGSISPEPMWMQVDADGEVDGRDAIITEFDPDVISSFRKAFEELSPKHPFHLLSQSVEKFSLRSQPDEPEKLAADEKRKVEDARNGPLSTGIVQARVQAFQEKIDAKRSRIVANGKPCGRPPGGEGKVVFYFTSLRGVRKTHEDCCSVRVILKGYAKRIDERDVSMHGGFKDELNDILGPGYGGSRLPRVFADGRYLGGAEEVRQMHDAGELREGLEGCEEVPPGNETCQGCGDMRFVPCETCSGSRKVYVEEQDGDGELDGERGEVDLEFKGFQRCPYCNENGLVLCPVCWNS